jgi:hypothetical protein
MGQMTMSDKPTFPSERIIETMIGLARCSRSHRILVSGSDGANRMFDLNRRGFNRVATTATCGLPRGQYDIAWVEWHQHSIRALETTLNWLVHFLAPKSALVIWIGSDVVTDKAGLESTVERLGFEVEAVTRSALGLAVSARRVDVNQQAMAA